MVTSVSCDTAEKLLEEMSPLYGRLWEHSRLTGQNPRNWIFRGMKADLPLRPSAFRENAFAPFIHAQVTRKVENAHEQRVLEDHVMGRFCTEADHAGVTVPGDRPELRDPRCAKDYDTHAFPMIRKLHMYALAQHYSIPTRLLDWTERPLVAAYFAAEHVAKVRGRSDEGKAFLGDHRCVVWALDRGILDKMAAKKPPADPTIFVVTAPKATNPNLHAQGGLFTLVQPLSGDPHPLPDLDECRKRTHRTCRSTRQCTRHFSTSSRFPPLRLESFFACWRLTVSTRQACTQALPVSRRTFASSGST